MTKANTMPKTPPNAAKERERAQAWLRERLPGDQPTRRRVTQQVLRDLQADAVTNATEGR